MNNFDLKKIHKLIPFHDVCTADNEYMKEVNSLPHIELDMEALYVITPKISVLFTPKLRYYRLLLENEINRHINDATALLEGDGKEELTKFVLKKTRESVTTLVNEAKHRLAITDKEDEAWKNITSDHPTFPTSQKQAIEYVVFLRNVIVELARCWLELQDRYAYVIGENGRYDVSLFYTSILNRLPDKEFELKHSEKYNKEAKKIKTHRTDCCFLYDNEEYFAIAIQAFTNTLIRHGLIPKDMDCKKMESLFMGRSCRRTYTWLKDNHILTHIIKGLTKGEHPIITTWPEGISPWTVISCRFVDKDGEHLPNIRQESSRKGTATIVEDAIHALSGHL